MNATTKKLTWIIVKTIGLLICNIIQQLIEDLRDDTLSKQ